MSGIEVVGMVLASFPLLISALEHSHRAAEVRDDWWQVKREYKKCKQELQCAELALENNLERFLLPLIVDDDEIKGLISEPGGSKWAEPALEVNLRSLLPKSYDLFVETVNEIKNVMDRLQAELGIANKPFMKLVEDNSLSGHSTNKKISESVKDWITKPKVDFWSRGREKLVSKSELQTQRVRFALGRTTRAKLFQDLEKYNVRLRDLLDTNDRSAGYKKSRIILKKSMVSETLWRFWRNAKSLYILLTQAFCCSCKQYHLAQLLLRHQTDVGQAEFQIRLLYSAEDSISSELWALKEVIIKRVNNDDIKDKQIIVPKTPRKTSSPNLLLRPALRGHDQSLGTTSENRPKVKWAALSESTLSGGIPPQDRGSAAITDLCHAIATSSPSTQCLGLLENSDDHYSLHQMPEQQQRGDRYESVTLASLLDMKSPLKLNRRQRYSLALTIASSHLQLYSSEWLGTSWTKHDVVILRDKSPPHSLLLDRTYVARHFAPHPTGSRQLACTTDDRALSTLGILLIELCYGMVLEDHDMRKQCAIAGGLPGSSTDLAFALDLAVALEWSRSVSGEAGEPYADAVEWCLRGRNIDSTGSKWRESFFKNVVEPLQFCCEQFSLKSP